MLNIAIQINGILHFKPIYGQEKLLKIQKLDQEKRDKCATLNIRLYEIDCQNDKYLNKTLKEIRWERVKKLLGE